MCGALVRAWHRHFVTVIRFIVLVFIIIFLVLPLVLCASWSVPSFVVASEEHLTPAQVCVTTRIVGCASGLLLATQRAAGKALPLPSLAWV